jgi:hypothetical protein
VFGLEEVARFCRGLVQGASWPMLVLHFTLESTMRASIFYTLAAAAMLLGATLFVSSRAQAMLPAGPSGLNSAIHETKAPQQVRLICRRGSYGRRCYHISRPHVGYVRPHASRRSEWDHPYNPYYWGSGVMTSD